MWWTVFTCPHFIPCGGVVFRISLTLFSFFFVQFVYRCARFFVINCATFILLVKYSIILTRTVAMAKLSLLWPKFVCANYTIFHFCAPQWIFPLCAQCTLNRRQASYTFTRIQDIIKSLLLVFFTYVRVTWIERKVRTGKCNANHSVASSI